MISREEAEGFFAYLAGQPDPDDPNVVNLTDDQRERATAALEAVGVERGDQVDVSHPLDLLARAGYTGPWAPAPRHAEMREWQEANGDDPGETTGIRWVDMSEVVGIRSGNYDRFEPSRLRGALHILLADRFDTDYGKGRGADPEIHFRDINGDLYVVADGSHRVMALKAVGVDRPVRARFDRYTVPTDRYQEWKAARDRGLWSSGQPGNPTARYNPPESERAPWPDGGPSEHYADAMREREREPLPPTLLDRAAALLRR